VCIGVLDMFELLGDGEALRIVLANAPYTSTKYKTGYLISSCHFLPYVLAAKRRENAEKWFWQLQQFYSSTSIIDTTIDAEVARVQGLLITFDVLSGFAVIFSVYHFSFYFPSVYRTNMQTKPERAMMLFVPHGVLPSF
jgi:hypothetical protein